MRLVTFAELKPRYGIPYCRDHLRRLVKAGKFPRPREIGPGRNGWIDAEIEDHLEAIAAQPPAPPLKPGDRRRRSS
jgi:prophage regulatory protein